MKRQKITARMFSLIGLLLLTTNIYSQDPDFYIFLCFGQSNMEGQGAIQTQDMTVDSRFQVMEAVNCSNLGRTMGSWYTATPPLCRCYNGLSPADYFGRTMVEYLPSNVKVGVVNVSVAGCKIELFDKTNYQTYASTVESWMTNIINEYGGNPYGRLVQIAKLAQADGVIKGILLHQGESNVNDNAWPSKVKGVYDSLMADLVLNPAEVPLLAGEVVNAAQGGICAGANSLIAQLPQTIPNSYVISSNGCTDATDNLHFNSAGYRELGKRYAAKMLSLLGIVQTVVQNHESFGVDGYLLGQNYPNPFNPSTTLRIELPSRSIVRLDVFNTLGQKIACLYNGELEAGYREFVWQAHTASGLYYYRLQATSVEDHGKRFIQTKKMFLMK